LLATPAVFLIGEISSSMAARQATADFLERFGERADRYYSIAGIGSVRAAIVRA